MTDSSELGLTRHFRASREAVFQAFTQSDRFLEWWGPAGFETTAIAARIEPGGRFHYRQTSPEGQTLWGVLQFKEIESPGRLVFTNAFSDEEGRIARAFFDENWPLLIRNTIVLDEEDGGTRLRMTGSPASLRRRKLRCSAPPPA
ncbi:SRPBCC domain-containing protein [Paenibacillus albicereus]|uniref:SRPBCC domain-containing protein n=1 Tax=Paenibacillus albicereus TaxID=2726185 RepID=A0A6H2GX18_9BACL|nr:SRPBCC domain-containing protein [Paenibacillus albicereus]QJC51945.1 SRPBCC domain-containing protein [Paenibacillus albicereus]